MPFFNLGRPQTTRHSLIINPQMTFMSNIQIFKENSQSINEISNFPAKSVNDVPNQTQKIKRKHLFNFERILLELIKKTPYPNFRFFCPYCASLDIFLTIEKTSSHLTIDCLDCKKRWIDLRSLKV